MSRTKPCQPLSHSLGLHTLSKSAEKLEISTARISLQIIMIMRNPGRPSSISNHKVNNMVVYGLFNKGLVDLTSYYTIIILSISYTGVWYAVG